LHRPAAARRQELHCFGRISRGLPTASRTLANPMNMIDFTTVWE
jgi:hypothetical protein